MYRSFAAEFKRLGLTMRLRAGQTLFREGDPATRVFTLTHGTLKLYKLLPDGRRHVVGFMCPGDFLGISIDAVKIRLHRARNVLREALKCECHLYHDERNELMCDQK